MPNGIIKKNDTNEPLWILRTYANQTDTYIEHRLALPTMYDMVNGYPSPIDITRYRNIQKYKKFITKYDKAFSTGQQNADPKLNTKNKWKATCINVLQHQNFNESWKLAACLPFYKDMSINVQKPFAQPWQQ